MTRPTVDYLTTQTVNYTIEPPARRYRTRPGVVTALGLACIIVAALSGVASSVVGMYGFGSLWILRMVTGYGTSAVYGGTGAVTPTPMMALPSGKTPVAASPLAPAGIASPEARRQIIKGVDAFHR